MNGSPFEIAQLQFLRPLWLLGLLVLPLLAWWWRAHARRRNPWEDAVDAHLLPHLLETRSPDAGSRWTRWSVLSAAAIAIVAMAGPSVRKDEHPLWQTAAPLVIAMDLSGAMLARDLPPSRLAQAKAKIATLLRQRQGGQVALVAFADDAFTVAPLTEDSANVALFLDAMSPDVMPVDGHRVDRALAWSQRLLRNAGYERGDILLFTDRSDGDGIAAAARLRSAGFRVSVIGVGSVQGSAFETPHGMRNARLDPASLRKLAASGGGVYRVLSAGDSDLRALGVLDPRAAESTSMQGGKVASRRDDGYWLLPLVLLLALPLFRRGASLAMLLAVAVLLPMPQAHAQDAGGLWRRTDQQAYQRMQEGVAAYRREQYDEAIEKFSGNQTAEGQYNLGNALAKAGRLDDAIAAYDRALKLRPAMEDAIENRKVVDAARKRKPPPGSQSDDNKPSRSQQPQRPRPDDPQDQQQADAAQRRRMEEALRKQQGTQGEPRQATPETPEQRERRIANQAQLRRVPDDPGSLLRAKFLLEHQRRQGRGP